MRRLSAFVLVASLLSAACTGGKPAVPVSVKGTLLLAGGPQAPGVPQPRPYTGIRLHIVGPKGFERIETTDGKGMFLMELAPGTYKVVIDNSDAQPLKNTFVVTSNGTNHFEFVVSVP